MAIDYEQFKQVLPDTQVRTQLGLMLTDGEARYLLENEPQAILYFQKWSAGGQGRTDQTPAGSWSRGAVLGFICSAVAALTAVVPAISTVTFAAALVGLFASFNGLSDTKKSGERGRGLAVAGIVLGFAAIAVGISVWAATRSAGA